MMIFSSFAAVLSLASLASAHFTLHNPYWRGSSFEGNASQWTWPCAGVGQALSANNRTLWPLTGGSVKAKFGHEWAITYINLGLGDVVTGFNVSLLDGFNQTGSGEFCIKEVGREALAKLDVKEGTNASIQVIQIAHGGAALYNCADITFSSKGSLLDDKVCRNSTNVGGVPLISEGGSGPGPSQGSPQEGSATSLSGSKSSLLAAAVAIGGAFFFLH